MSRAFLLGRPLAAAGVSMEDMPRVTAWLSKWGMKWVNTSVVVPLQNY